MIGSGNLSLWTLMVSLVVTIYSVNSVDAAYNPRTAFNAANLEQYTAEYQNDDGSSWVSENYNAGSSNRVFQNRFESDRKANLFLHSPQPVRGANLVRIQDSLNQPQFKHKFNVMADPFVPQNNEVNTYKATTDDIPVQDTNKPHGLWKGLDDYISQENKRLQDCINNAGISEDSSNLLDFCDRKSVALNDDELLEDNYEAMLNSKVMQDILQDDSEDYWVARQREYDLEQEKLAREEQEKLELERKAKLSLERVSKLARERQERLEREKKERHAREEQERLAREKKERLAREKKERLAREEKERLAREEKERLAREEKERLARERKERIALEKKERLAREEQERLARAERKRLAREEQERLEREKKEKLDRERRAKQEQEEKEKLELEEKQRLEREEKEKAAAYGPMLPTKSMKKRLKMEEKARKKQLEAEEKEKLAAQRKIENKEELERLEEEKLKAEIEEKRQIIKDRIAEIYFYMKAKTNPFDFYGDTVFPLNDRIPQSMVFRGNTDITSKIDSTDQWGAQKVPNEAGIRNILTKTLGDMNYLSIHKNYLKTYEAKLNSSTYINYARKVDSRKVLRSSKPNPILLPTAHNIHPSINKKFGFFPVCMVPGPDDFLFGYLIGDPAIIHAAVPVVATPHASLIREIFIPVCSPNDIKSDVLDLETASLSFEHAVFTDISNIQKKASTLYVESLLENYLKSDSDEPETSDDEEDEDMRDADPLTDDESSIYSNDNIQVIPSETLYFKIHYLDSNSIIALHKLAAISYDALTYDANDTSPLRRKITVNGYYDDDKLFEQIKLQ